MDVFNNIKDNELSNKELDRIENEEICSICGKYGKDFKNYGSNFSPLILCKKCYEIYV